MIEINPIVTPSKTSKSVRMPLGGIFDYDTSKNGW